MIQSDDIWWGWGMAVVLILIGSGLAGCKSEPEPTVIEIKPIYIKGDFVVKHEMSETMPGAATRPANSGR